MCHFLSTAHQLFINLFINFFINCSSTFFLYQLCVSSLSTLPTFCQLFINFWTTVYQLFIILIELMNAHCLSPVCAECLAFKGATAGASRCRAPPPSRVAATTKDYGCIWKDKQCVCANSGTYAKSSHFAGIRIMAWQMRGTQPRSSTADNLWGGHKAQHKAPVPPLPLVSGHQWHPGTKLTLKGRLDAQPCGASHDLQSFWTPCMILLEPCCLDWQIEAQTSQRVKGSRNPNSYGLKFHKDQHSVNHWSFQTLLEKIQSLAILLKITPREMWP